MKNKIIAAGVAGGLLVGAGLVTAVVSAPSAASAQEDAAESKERGVFHRGMDFLSEVLADLVDDGTIDQAQADAIVAAVETKAEEVRTERQAQRELIAGFLEDDVITSDELAQLPDDHPFNNPDGPYAEAAADGELTMEEIKENFPHRHGAFKRGARFGALLDDGGIDQAEYDALIEDVGEDHWIAQIDVSEYLADGLITLDELRQIKEDLGGFGGKPEA